MDKAKQLGHIVAEDDIRTYAATGKLGAGRATLPERVRRIGFRLGTALGPVDPELLAEAYAAYDSAIEAEDLEELRAAYLSTLHDCMWECAE